MSRLLVYLSTRQLKYKHYASIPFSPRYARPHRQHPAHRRERGLTRGLYRRRAVSLPARCRTTPRLFHLHLWQRACRVYHMARHLHRPFRFHRYRLDTDGRAHFAPNARAARAAFPLRLPARARLAVCFHHGRSACRHYQQLFGRNYQHLNRSLITSKKGRLEISKRPSLL